MHDSRVLRAPRTHLVLPAVLAALSLLTAMLGVWAASPARATTPDCTVEALPLGAATGWTEFVEGNGSRGSESEGRIAYGGSVNGMSVGSHLPGSITATTPSLVVAGGSAGPFNLQRGSSFAPGAIVNHNHPGGGAGPLGANPIDFPAAFGFLRDLSDQLAAVPANGTTTMEVVPPVGNMNSRVLRGTDPVLNVFSLTAAQVASSGMGFAFDVPDGSTTIVNVTGNPVSFSGKSGIAVAGSWQQAHDDDKAQFSRILWNFPDATSLHLGLDTPWMGSVLAPDAVTTTGNTSHVIGSVMVKSYTSNIETHYAPLDPSVCIPGEGEPPPPPTESDVKVTKTAAPGTPMGGEQVVYTLLVENVGDADATGVVVTDELPAGLTWVSASAPCTRAAGPNAAGTVTCHLGTIAPGGSTTATITVIADPIAGSGPVPHPGATHHVTVFKDERQVDLEPGETETVTMSCAGGGILTDGSVRADHVDQGTGTLASVKVLSARTTGTGTWEAVVRNDATGRAQAKAFIVCLPAQTEWADGHQHALVVSPTTVSTTAAHAAGRHTATLTCPAGTMPVAPGFQYAGGAAHLAGSEPSSSPANSWTFTSDVTTATTATYSMRCLDRQVATALGHTHGLRTTHVVRNVVLPAHTVVEEQVHCPDDAKGMVGTWLLPPGVQSFGNDPRVKTRAFKLFNGTAAPQSAMVDLECVGDRTGEEELEGVDPLPITNTATVVSASSDADPGNNSSAAQITVQPGSSSAVVTPKAVVSGRQVALRLLSSARSRGVLVLRADGKVLARGEVRLSGKGMSRAKVRLTAAGRSAIAAGATTAKVKLSLDRGHARAGSVTFSRG